VKLPGAKQQEKKKSERSSHENSTQYPVIIALRGMGTDCVTKGSFHKDENRKLANSKSRNTNLETPVSIPGTLKATAAKAREFD
jgi:hypothetical protein